MGLLTQTPAHLAGADCPRHVPLGEQEDQGSTLAGSKRWAPASPGSARQGAIYQFPLLALSGHANALMNVRFEANNGHDAMSAHDPKLLRLERRLQLLRARMTI
jgi:hypothetical protein